VKEFAPTAEPTNVFWWKLEYHKSIVRLALHELWLENVYDSNKLQVMVKPSRAVFAADILKPHTLIAPLGTCVFIEEGSKALAGYVPMDYAFDHKGKKWTAHLCKKEEMNPNGKDGFFAPYFFIRTVGDGLLANVQHAVFKVHLQVLDKLVTISIPILRNSKTIKKSSELLLYKAEEAIKLDQPAKRAAAPETAARNVRGRGRGKK
jgi:hypothetical protein